MINSAAGSAVQESKDVSDMFGENGDANGTV